MVESAIPGVGDILIVTITKPLPFGSLCETADGATGLVTNLRHAAEGDSLAITVDAVDTGRHRFSGMAN